MTRLDERVDAIEERNARVGDDKAWETSWVRRTIICAIIYLCGVATLDLLGHDGAWKHAVVPVMGYILSTLTLPAAKKMWLADRKRDKSASKDLDNVTIH